MDSWILLANDSVRTNIVANPLLPLTLWWQFILCFLLSFAGLVLVVWLAILDRKDQPIGVSIGLAMLRVSLLVVVVLAFCNFERRREQVSVEPSTIAIILDNSLSMNLESARSDDVSRFDVAKSNLQQMGKWHRLANEHRLIFYKFNEQGRFDEFDRWEKPSIDTRSDTKNLETRPTFGIWFIGLSALLFLVSGIGHRSPQLRSLFILTGVVTLIFGLSWISFAFVADDSNDFFTDGPTTLDVSPAGAVTLTDSDRKNFQESLANVNCDVPASPIVQSFNWFLDRLESRSLSAILIFTDGVDSNGSGFLACARKAKNQSITLFPVGSGTTQGTENTGIKDIFAEQKVYLGNPFTVSGSLILESKEFPVELEVTLSASPIQDSQVGKPLELEKKTLTLRQPGINPIAFDVQNSPVGTRLYELAVKPLDGEVDLTDNQALVKVEVVDRKAKVLLWAGGPNREFRFLRNQLYRDPNIELDVFLQSSEDGSIQESDRQLTEFPSSMTEFIDYDCVIGFDPDWTALTSSQTEMVRTWVADESGGLIVVAGPVNTPSWTSLPTNNEVVKPVRKLYPVSFFGQVSGSITLGRFGGADPFPLSFTQAANSFDFLKFDTDPEENSRIWNEVEVFGFYAVNEEKAGADVIARFSDPLTSFGGKLPIYLASHLYGNGRVFFQASGELWRTRGVGPEFFEQYYSRLIRWTSQGRLLRGDDPLTLSVDKSKCTVGDYVTVRAMVNRSTSELEGLNELDVAMVIRDTTGDSIPEQIRLPRSEVESNRPAFENRIQIRSTGRHVFKLILPGSGDRVLETELVSTIPNRELVQPGRNDEGLNALANETGGSYTLSTEFDQSNLIETIQSTVFDHSIESIAPLTNDSSFKRKIHFCLFGCFSVLIICNWLIRRLNRLA